MTRLVATLVLAIAAAAIALPAAAAPKAKSPGECALYADLALVAAAAAKHGVPRARLEAMLADIYVLRDDGRTLARLIVDVVYRTPNVGGAPRQFAELLGNTCLRAAGDMDGILGTSI